jgi:hypothetical protein
MRRSIDELICAEYSQSPSLDLTSLSPTPCDVTRSSHDQILPQRYNMIYITLNAMLLRFHVSILGFLVQKLCAALNCSTLSVW